MYIIKTKTFEKKNYSKRGVGTFRVCKNTWIFLDIQVLMSKIKHLTLQRTKV